SSELEDKEIDDSAKEYIEKWVSAICKWLIISHKDLVNIQPSSIFLGKVWIRLYFSLVGVANSKENWHDLGKIISLYTHCLINAFLVEEEDHHFKILNLNKEKFLTKKTNRQNPKNSLKPLNEKLKELKNNNFDSFPLTKMIANCPVIQGLITNNKDAYINEATFVSMLPNTIGNVMISGIDIGGEEEVVLKILNENKKRLLDNRDRLYHQRQVRKSKLNIANNLLEENREKIIVNNNDLKNLKNILIQLDFNSDLNSDYNKNKIIEEIENKEHELSELEKNRVNIEKDIELENEILGSINSTIRELTSEIRKINAQIRELKEKGELT
ncbi:TPA: hypothetical protein ACGAN4_000576, partial [Acinetobacter baumannii]